MEDDLASAAQRRWVGSGSLPAHLGYANATTPLVVLELTGSRLTLRARPKFMAKLLGISVLQATAGGEIFISPARKWWANGIEFRAPGLRSYYFWTPSHAEILAALSDAGFAVSAAEAR